jgi:hypothetical protein
MRAQSSLGGGSGGPHPFDLDLSSRLNRLTDVQAIADAIVSEAARSLAYHDIRVYVVNWDEGFCEPVAYTDRLLGRGDFHERLRPYRRGLLHRLGRGEW